MQPWLLLANPSKGPFLPDKTMFKLRSWSFKPKPFLIPKNDSSKIRNVFKNIPHMINSKPQTHVKCSYRFSDRTASWRLMSVIMLKSISRKHSSLNVNKSSHCSWKSLNWLVWKISNICFARQRSPKFRTKFHTEKKCCRDPEWTTTKRCHKHETKVSHQTKIVLFHEKNKAWAILYKISVTWKIKLTVYSMFKFVSVSCN